MPVIKHYNQNFFKVWTRDMAYILGFLYADGNIIKTKRGTYYISWYSADKVLLQAIKKVVEAEHLISLRATSSGKVYRMQIGSFEWFEDLYQLGLTPNKTKRLRLPNIPRDLIGDFVRGYFDGDGNVWVGTIHKNRSRNTKTIQTSFTCASSDFLYSLKDLLHSVGLTGGGIYVPKNDTFARLTFSVQDTLKIYKLMYTTGHKLFLERKRKQFVEFFDCGGSSTG
jgi:intein-encoded DNA endonuclease-like protein